MVLNKIIKLVCDLEQPISQLDADILQVFVFDLRYCVVSVEFLDEVEDTFVVPLGLLVLVNVSPEFCFVIGVENVEGCRVLELTEARFEPSLVVNVLLSFSNEHFVVLVFGRSLNFSDDLFPFLDLIKRV